MKRTIFCLLCLMAATGLSAQDMDETSKTTTEYPSFQKATVVTENGKTLKLWGNIFLKDGSFVYKKGSNILRAKTETIKSVSFGDDNYYRCDSMLAKLIDTCNSNMLLESRLIDRENWVRRIQNSQDITSLTMRDVVQFSTVDHGTYEDDPFPIFRDYFFVYNGEIVHASDRVMIKKIPKDKRQQFRALTEKNTFNWRDKECLKKLLKFISGVSFDEIKD